MEATDCLKEQSLLWSVKRRCCGHSGKQFYRIAEKSRLKYVVSTEAMRAEET